ncbi:MAG: NERD domain-containing protein [Verrucomicrobia bacterium]|nr:NERD domain-containing protein [Verrucomicrobiota bacterium]
MWLTTMLVLIAIALFEGGLFTALIVTRALVSWSALALGLVGLCATIKVCRDQSRRIDEFERERMNWRRGAVGEQVVSDTLACLPENYFVLNDVKTSCGNLDHVVIGPTGLFAIETKNWRGVVAADGAGELLTNGSSCSTAEIRKLLRRTMLVREQVMSLTGRDVYMRAVMVFPRARVEAAFGSTGKVHCVTDERLCSYIEEPAFSQKLRSCDVDQICRALEGIARMEPAFDRERKSVVATKSTATVTST